ncbi:YccF domain-containing protein [Psychromonas sp. Urea-02u-13]|uniref:YccF domain-containing protein n=1 Tax=Psychromonas sp. Urea-02u-13 TaxID=2058326 RepID=UPI000C326A16|nr:YccF domain-containing protein [Psychromonas sp. Urea-02u-13]PKG39188.1 YccF domain-containing protein [Psychromonas sp. Urea-02u-13]
MRWLIGIFAFMTIIGIPWAKACFIIGNFSFLPFGKEPIDRKYLTGNEDIGTGDWTLIGNVIWCVLAGFWLALGHLASAVACTMTIIGIPFAIQHLKLAMISFAPIGQTIVSKEIAESARVVNRARL